MGVPTEADDLLVALAVPTKLPHLGVFDNAERLALAVRRHYFDFDKVGTVNATHPTTPPALVLRVWYEKSVCSAGGQRTRH